MTVTNIDRQLTLDFSVPANSPLPNPTLADKLQKLAAAMDITIESKLKPSIGQQNITARRSRIAASMREDEGGAGDICVALRDFGVENIDCFELNAGLVEALTLLGFPPLGRDFLSATPHPIYDRILMNPPFGEDAHIEHIRHAYDWLASGGELVAVLPVEHPSRIKKRRQFLEWLDELGAVGEASLKGNRYPNPPKSFTSSDRYCAVETHLIHLCR